MLGLVGESGCGKTMTALSLLGLLPSGVSVTGGQILWNGKNLAAATDKDMEGIRGRDIALISQEPMRALDPMFTVGYQLTAAIRRLRKMGKAEARAEALGLLEKVGIVDAAAHPQDLPAPDQRRHGPARGHRTGTLRPAPAAGGR